MDDAAPVWGAVVVAAGAGTRFGGVTPKQFTCLGGRMVIEHSIGLFAQMVPVVVAVIPAGFPWSAPEGVLTVPGGERRQDSVIAGLRKAMEKGVTHVLVHDGARPMIDRDTVERVMDVALSTGACLPCIPVRDTVKMISGGTVLETLDRNGLQLAQTPQAFSASLLLDALERAESVTDESSALEVLGIKVAVVEGSRFNIKLTDREDMIILKGLMERSVTGLGIDFHPFSHRRPLVLCGCRLSPTDGLMGHSDGDVVLHAAADALLSAARLGDIGTLFPPGDMKWKDADSAVLLATCMKMVTDAGWQLVSMDVTVIGERPRVSPDRKMFRERLAGILQVPVESVWIKGTTTNTIGDLARGEGLGCVVLAELAGLS